MDANRILELAVEALENQKAGINAEIEKIRAELRSMGSNMRQTRSFPLASIRTRSRTPAQRRLQSQRMKRYWASKKKAEEAKPAVKPKTPAAGAKVRVKTDAEKKALSLKMKEVWRKTKAEAAKKKR